ncbi:MAG: hypothetical protein SGBAC_011412 [Bacillariaceae sp.]
MGDIVYAEDDLSSIGSESAFGEDIASDQSVGSTVSSLDSLCSLGPLDTKNRTTAEISIDQGYGHEYDDLLSCYESDLESDCEEEDEEEDYGDENNMTQYFHSFDVEATDDDLSFVSDDFDLNVSFSDDEDELISESNRFERTIELTPSTSLRKRVPADVHITSQEGSYSQRSTIVQYDMPTKESVVPGVCSFDTSLRLQRTIIRLPSRSVSLDVSVRL